MDNKKIVQKVILGAVIMRDNKILILQRNKNEDTFPNIWELPSGKKELLEISEKCLIREVKEETGLNVQIVIPISVFDYQVEKPKEIRDSTQINFLVKPINNKVKLSSEHQNFAWISENEIGKYQLSRVVKKSLKKAFEINKVFRTFLLTSLDLN